ncbi:MAG: hypothetical protein ACREFP_05565 [Acetobacteraceae bacterium]
MPGLELDGYLTGTTVAPGLTRPNFWTARLSEDDRPIFDNVTQMAALTGRFDAEEHADSQRRDTALLRAPVGDSRRFSTRNNP